MIDIIAVIDELEPIINAAVTFKSTQKYIIRQTLATSEMPACDIAPSTLTSKIDNDVSNNEEAAVMIVLRNKHVERAKNGKEFMQQALSIAEALEYHQSDLFDVVEGVDINPTITENGEGSYVFSAILTVHLTRG